MINPFRQYGVSYIVTKLTRAKVNGIFQNFIFEKNHNFINTMKFKIYYVKCEENEVLLNE